MEISEVILNEAWLEKNQSPPDPKLEKIVVRLMALDTKKFVDKKNKPCNAAYRKIHELHSVWMSRAEAGKIKKLPGYVIAMQNCLDHAFRNANLPGLFSFLMVQSYFSVRLMKFLNDGNYTQDQKDKLEKQIHTLLSHLKFDFTILKKIPYYEENLLKVAKKAETEGDLQGYYRLISSIERSTGLIFNPLVARLCLFYYHLNAQGFASFIPLVKNPLNIIFYLHGLSKEELVDLAGKVGYGYWLNFEITRRIDFLGRKDYSGADLVAAEKQFSVIYHNDRELFKKVIRYFTGSELTMRAFGVVSRELPASFIIEIFRDCFTLNEYANRLSIHDVLLEELKTALQPADLKLVLEGIYNISDNYIESLLLKDDFYLSLLLATDFAPYVAAHYQYNYTEEQIKDAMNMLMDGINNIESEWFASASKATTKYHWYGSKLYIFSVAFINKGLTDAAIKNRIEQLAKNDFQLSRYKRSDEPPIEKAWKMMKDYT